MELTDTQLVLRIRRILASPSGHMGWKQLKDREANLARLMAEANRRGIGW
jgi:hypothetical protein